MKHLLDIAAIAALGTMMLVGIWAFLHQLAEHGLN